jgi:hypothetical protein
MGITSFTLDGLGVDVPASGNVARTIPGLSDAVKAPKFAMMAAS